MKTGVYIIKNYLYHPLGENYKLFCGGGGGGMTNLKLKDKFFPLF